MIEAVVFDVGGVLGPSPVGAFAALDDEYALPSKTVEALVRGGDRFAEVETGWLPVADFYRDCADSIRTAHGAEIPVERFDTMMTGLMGANLRPEMLELVEQIKAAGYGTALLTNIYAERRAWLHSIFPPGVIDVYCDSSEVGLRKPDRAIYEKLLELLGRRAEEVVFVDDFTENLIPAREMGMATVLFESPEQTRRELVEAGVRIERAQSTVEG